MKRKPKVKYRYWTKEKCVEVAKKCKFFKEFRENYPTAYVKYKKNIWIRNRCKHLKYLQSPNGYWTKDRCIKEAKKYHTKKDFRSKSYKCYRASKRRGCYKQCCEHMLPLGNLFKRLIYVITFSNNHAYIGLTFDFETRMKRHLREKGGTVFKYMKETKLKPITMQKLTGFHIESVAQKKEEYFRKKYIKLGFIMLNKAKTGGLGNRTQKWTKEQCHKMALLCKTYTEFQKKYSGAYTATKKNNWTKFVCSHIKKQIQPNRYWTKERCLNKALKCKTRKEFRKKYGAARVAAQENGWYNQCCKHMLIIKTPNGYWTKKRCLYNIKKYKTLKKFRTKSPRAYMAIMNNNWKYLLRGLKRYSYK